MLVGEPHQWLPKNTNIYLDSVSRRQRGLLSTRTSSGQAATKFGLAVDQRGWPTLWRLKGYAKKTKTPLWRKQYLHPQSPPHSPSFASNPHLPPHLLCTTKEKPAISSLLDPSASLPLYQPTHLQPTIQRLWFFPLVRVTLLSHPSSKLKHTPIKTNYAWRMNRVTWSISSADRREFSIIHAKSKFHKQQR